MTPDEFKNGAYPQRGAEPVRMQRPETPTVGTLAPCPFCGSCVDLRTSRIPRSTAFLIRCNCGVQMEWSGSDIDEDRKQAADALSARISAPLPADVAKLIGNLRDPNRYCFGATSLSAADALERLSAQVAAWQSAAATGDTPAPGAEYTPARLEARLTAHMAERDKLRAELAAAVERAQDAEANVAYERERAETAQREAYEARTLLVRIVNEGTDGCAAPTVSLDFLRHVPAETAAVKRQRDAAIARATAAEERERQGCTAYRGMLEQAEDDLAGARENVEVLEEALSEATYLLHRCNGTFVPGNDEANAEIAAACRRFAALFPPPQAPQDANEGAAS